MSKSYSSCPPSRLHGGSGKTVFLHLKNYCRERNSKIVESILRKPVGAITLTASGLYKKKYSLPSSFGSNENHIQSLRLHMYIYSKFGREKDCNSSECCVPRKSSRVLPMARLP
jgi:hypothetical protein